MIEKAPVELNPAHGSRDPSQLPRAVRKPVIVRGATPIVRPEPPGGSVNGLAVVRSVHDETAKVVLAGVVVRHSKGPSLLAPA